SSDRHLNSRGSDRYAHGSQRSTAASHHRTRTRAPDIGEQSPDLAPQPSQIETAGLSDRSALAGASTIFAAHPSQRAPRSFGRKIASPDSHLNSPGTHRYPSRSHPDSRRSHPGIVVVPS